MVETDKAVVDRTARFRQVQRVTWVSTAVDLVLSVVKLLVGIWVRSPALVADGIHSLSDLLTDAFVLFINRVSHSEPDAEHPYGHARFENIGTMLLGGMITAVAVGLAWENGARLLSGGSVANPSLWAIAAVVFSLVAKEGLYHYGQYWACRLDSEILQANAWHSRSDSLSSLVVLVGVLATWIGYDQVEGWAALILAGLIGHMGLGLVWNSLQKLADRGLPERTRQAIADSVMQVPGVSGVHALRSRIAGNQVFVDMHLQVAPFISVSEGHQIAVRARHRLENAFPELGDILLHVDTEDEAETPGREIAPTRLEIEIALAKYPALAANDRMIIHYRNQRVILDLFFQGPPGAACSRESDQAVASLPWLEGVGIHQVHRE